MSGPDQTPQQPGLVGRVARVTAKHRRAAVIGWLMVLVAALGASGAVGTEFSNNFSLPGTESQRAANLLKRNFPAQAGDSDQIVVAAARGLVSEAAIRGPVTAMLTKVAALPHVTGVVSPYSAKGANAISPDAKIAFATVTFNERANLLPTTSVEKVVSTAKSIASPRLRVALGGQAIEQVQKPSLGAATGIGLLAAIVVLVITFGSFLAMGLPIITALLGLGTGIGLAGLASHLIGMPDFSTELAAMIGLGVGIDYALFIVTRFRENFIAERDVQNAIAGAMDTAGRAVLFAGTTVIIALLGQFALGVEFLYGLAVASVLAVLMTMLAALSVLPALLSRFGERIGSTRASRRHARRASAAPGQPTPAVAGSTSGFWARWAGAIERHPWPGAIVGIAIMLALASPVLALRLGNSDAGNNPPDQTTRQAFDLLAKGFGPGFNGPLQVVASLPRAGDTGALAAIASSLRGTADVASVAPPRVSPVGLTAVFNVYPRSAPQALATSTLVHLLRDTKLPPLAAATNTTLLVGGTTALTIDFTHVLSSKLPLFIGVVVLLSALLLLVVFRSLVIPLQAAFMNLLSIGASLGIVVAIFQWGWLGGFFNVKGAPIQAFIPVMLFAIVFGLSMDYEVFLISRVHEEWTRTHDARRAASLALASTGRVITAAATIMICVFLSFVAGGERVLELFGLSLASAVFLDAFVVRCLLLPATLQILGGFTWALPGWLGTRLPHIAIDRGTGTVPALEEGV